MSRLPLRPCLALPFTILTGPDRVHLIAGEDFRYTLDAPGLETWLPEWLAKLDGRLSVDEAVATAPTEQHAGARQLIARLYGERVLIDGPAPAARKAGGYHLQAQGNGPLFAGLVGATAAPDGDPGRVVTVFCQDRLDYEAALRFNDRQLRGGGAWFWLTVGPMSRGYVSPLFLPDAGPCLCCLLTHFRRLSPAPELYDRLTDHGHAGRRVEPATFPPQGVAVLQQLLLWKAELLREPEAPAALFQLHVLEVSTLEVSAHGVFCDPECPACSGQR
jgi:bacteriocin biosynthesis cyclodehydratase domain-containing protein